MPDQQHDHHERRRLRFFAGTATSFVFLCLAGASDADDTITLTSGDRFSGTVTERSDDAVTLEHRFGTLVIPTSEISGLTIGDEVIIAAPAAGEAPPAESEAAVEEGPTGEWKGHVNVNGSGSFGNTDTQGFSVAVTLARETVRETTLIDAGYSYGASNGDRTTNRFTAGIRHDWLLPDSPWFFFAQGRYDYDEFQSWEHRLTAHGGVGYKIVDTDTFDFALRGGLGVAQEFNVDTTRFEALIGADLGWQISERQRFELSTTLYPELTDIGEFRWVTTAAWTVLMDEETNMSFAAGLRNEYQSMVEPGIQHNDLYVFAGLQFDF